VARKTESLTIPGARSDKSGERDNGKTFVLTEMPSIQGERWATQALSLISKAGQKLPRGAEDAGMAGLAAIPMNALPVLQALQDPSLDSWWECVKYQHDPKHPLLLQPIYPNEACQIEEIGTVNLLRMKVLEMHIGFFSQGSPSTSGAHSATTRGS
jgi:hypothetical protein